jgi:hypothetical protein
MKMSIIALITVFVAATTTLLTAQDVEVRRAVQLDKWRSLPHETCWQWLVRTGMCITGRCDGGHGTMAYMNWGDAHAPVYDNLEVEPDAELMVEYPFMEPNPREPRYSARAEREIKTRMRNGVHDETLSRVYRRGMFEGYTRRAEHRLVTI